MTTVQCLTLMAVVYIAPSLAPVMRLVMSGACLALATVLFFVTAATP